MENRAHAVATGLFIVFLGMLLAVSLWWFSNDKTPMNEYILVSRSTVNGLSVQSRVSFRGIAAGNVSSIKIDPEDPRNILVRIRIRADLPVTKGTRAFLGTQGVTGLAFVQLDDRGEDPVLLVPSAEGEPPRLALEGGLIERLTDTATTAAARFKEAGEKLVALFNDENMARMSRVIARLESASNGIDKTFSEAPDTLAAIRTTLNPENVERISRILQNVDHMTAEAAPAVQDMRTLANRLTSMVERLDHVMVGAGQGVAQETLPEFNRLLQELNVTTQRFGQLLVEVEQSPQILLRGRGGEGAGPGEAGFNPAHP